MWLSLSHHKNLLFKPLPCQCFQNLSLLWMKLRCFIQIWRQRYKTSNSFLANKRLKSKRCSKTQILINLRSLFLSSRKNNRPSPDRRSTIRVTLTTCSIRSKANFKLQATFNSLKSTSIQVQPNLRIWSRSSNRHHYSKFHWMVEHRRFFNNKTLNLRPICRRQNFKSSNKL